jgi:MFS family permease
MLYDILPVLFRMGQKSSFKIKKTEEVFMYNLFFVLFITVFGWLFFTAIMPEFFADIYPQRIRGFVIVISTLITAVIHTAAMILAIIGIIFNKFNQEYRILFLIFSPIGFYIFFILWERSLLIIKIIIQLLKINRLLKNK